MRTFLLQRMKSCSRNNQYEPSSVTARWTVSVC